VDISGALDELTGLIESARAMPMSASCIINRQEVLDAIDTLRAGIPEELTRAKRVLGDKSAVIDQGHQEAQRIIDEALAERHRLISHTEVVKEASREAERLIAAAQAESDRVRVDVDDYVDAKLANFQIILQRTLDAVEHGREKIQGRHAELAALDEPGEPIEPLPT
jgi:cell division septum initiation protein DivIVA